VRTILKIVAGLMGLLVALSIGAIIWLQDANRLKPEIQALIAEHTDYEVEIRGNLSWQLFPPLKLNLTDLAIQQADASQDNQAQTIHAATLDLEMDLSAIWQDVNRWRVKGFALTDTQVMEDGSTTQIDRLVLKNFALNEPAPLQATITLDPSPSSNADVQEEATAAEPLQLDLEGLVSYHPSTTTSGERVRLRDLLISSALVKGTCHADVVENQTFPENLASLALAQDQEDALLPLATLAEFDLTADCNLAELNLDGETFTNVELQITNVAGQLNAVLNIAEFMDGSVMIEADIDATSTVPSWTIVPEVSGVDSQRLLNWTDQRLQWIAPIALNSTIKLSGNTEQALAQSIEAQSDFDGGQGQLNIAKLKEQLLRVASFTRSGDNIANWPDLWNYEHFTGRWIIDGPQHSLNFALDNMSVKADGEVDYLANNMDMLAYVTIHEAPEASPFDINPLLQDTPIPVRCRGPSDDPKCRVDEGAVQNIVARALQGGEESGLRRKLDQKIEEKVPEEYRDAARNLLDLLGRSLERE